MKNCHRFSIESGTVGLDFFIAPRNSDAMAIISSLGNRFVTSPDVKILSRMIRIKANTDKSEESFFLDFIIGKYECHRFALCSRNLEHEFQVLH
jgi:hypothetical protein